MNADHYLMLAFEGLEPDDGTKAILAEGACPGVSLFRYANVESREQLVELTARLERANGSDLPLLIAADQETGQLMGLGDHTTPFAGPMALGATGDVALVEEVATAIGREVRAQGVTVNYAPACDVASNPDNPSLGIRAFSDDPETVGAMSAAAVRGFRSAGVVSVAKHFPGKGEAVVDPHHGLPVLDLDRDRLDAVELAPFRRVIAEGVPAIMSGHYALPQLTGRRDLPSTVTPLIIRDLLRDDLGFEGVVITDALNMKALPQGVGQIVDTISAIRSGVDLLLNTPEPEPLRLLRAGLDLAVSRGLIAGADRDARQRVDALRRWVASTSAPPIDVVASIEHRRLADEVARRSVTLVRDDGPLLPLAPAGGTLLAVMPTPEDLTPADTSATVVPCLAGALRVHHDAVTEIVTAHRPSPSDIASVVAVAESADIVVVGTISAGPEQADLVNALLATDARVVTVAIRTPFDLAAYPRAITHLCTYSIHRPSMDALASVLFGAAPALGRLPVAIPGLYPRGHGLTNG